MGLRADSQSSAGAVGNRLPQPLNAAPQGLPVLTTHDPTVNC
jgi:hypothetical protein